MVSNKKKLPKVCKRIAPVAIAGVLYVLGLYATIIYSSDWTAIQTCAVILTGGVVIWYTWETRQLRQVALAQIDIQIRPFVVVEYEDRQFRIRNLGPGTALNVKVRNVTINAKEEITVDFPDHIPILTAGEVRSISVTSSHGNHSAGDFFAFHVKPGFATRGREITVDFENVAMKRMSVVLEVWQGELRIVRGSPDFVL
jgi:hypothetical protein